MKGREIMKLFQGRPGAAAIALIGSSAMIFSAVAYRSGGLENALFVIGMYALIGGAVAGMVWLVSKANL